VLNQAMKTLSNPEYQQQLTKLTQSSIVNSLQTFQRLSTLSTRLSNMDNETMSEVVEGSIDDLTRALLQFNSDQLVLLQRLSARTLEILDAQARQK
jgi:predicted DNA-binding protein